MEQHSQSQSSQRYNFTSHNTTYNEHDYQLPSNDSPYSNASQPTINSDDLALLVDHLANNYGLEVDYRNELHTFLEASIGIAQSLPCASVKVASIQQATMLQTHRVLQELKRMCTTTQDSITTIHKSLSDNVKVSKDQTGIINAACRLLFFSGHRMDFDNDTLKPEAHLQKHKTTHSFALFDDDKTQRHTKLITVHVGHAVSGVKTFFGRTKIVKSIPDSDTNAA
ncbi:hypothetical protein B0H10DRAFT_2225847 [Mycena sp. CBHHK59/15]|nr:hypothetical protein B0H10DRAFT_2225847 [Mycena sp. CBHHK59/15]